MTNTPQVLEHPAPAKTGFFRNASAWRNKSKVVILVVIFLALAAGAAWWYIARQNEAANMADAQRLDNSQFSFLQAQDETDRAQGKYVQAALDWTKYAQTTPNKQHRGSAWEYAGTLYMSTSDYKMALDSFRKSESANGLNYNLAQETATAAMRIGDKTEAIHYLQKAIQLTPDNILYAKAKKQLYQEEINKLSQKK